MFMKNILLFSLIISVAFLSGCDDDEVNYIGKRNAGFVPVISDLNPAIYIEGQIDNSYVEFNVSVEEDADIDEAFVEVSFNGVSERLRVYDITSFPASLTFHALDVVEDLGLSADDLEGGDFFLFEVVTRSGTVVSRSSASVSILVACPSDIAGVYSLVAKGTGGGGLGALAGWESSIETIEITSKDGGVTYTIEPALGGLMVDFYSAYGATTVVGEFQDICGTITNAVVNDGWSAVNYSGSVDSETGIITISWDNPWGDKANMTLTPIEE